MKTPFLIIALAYAAVGAYGLIFGEYSFYQKTPGFRRKRVRYTIHGQKARYWAYGWFVAAVVAFMGLTPAFVALVAMVIMAVPLIERESRSQSRARRRRAERQPQHAPPVSKTLHTRINSINPDNPTPADMRELVRIVENGADAGLDWRESLMAGDRQGASDIQAGQRAYEMLHKIGEPSLPYLLEADLSKNDFKGVFKKIGPPAVEPLLANDRPGQRAGAASVLGSMQVEAAVEPLIGLLDDPDDTVRLNAVKALGLLGDVRARQPMERLKDTTTSSGALKSALNRALNKLDQSQ